MNVRLGLIEKGYPRDLGDHISSVNFRRILHEQHLEPTQKYKIISPFFKAEHTKS